MNSETLNRWFSLVANIGVIAGIVFLGIEVQQNSALMRIQIQQARADSAFAAQEASYNSDHMIPIIVKAFSPNETLSIEESLRFNFFVRGMHKIQENFVLQYEAGMLGEPAIISVEEFVRSIMASPAARALWEEGKIQYVPEYIELVDRIVNDLPN